MGLLSWIFGKRRASQADSPRPRPRKQGTAGREASHKKSYKELYTEYARSKGDPLRRVAILGRMGAAAVTSEQQQEVKVLAAKNAADVKFDSLAEPTIEGHPTLHPWSYYHGEGRARFLEQMWEYLIEPGHAMFGIPVQFIAENIRLGLALFRLLDGSERLAVLHDTYNGEVTHELNQVEVWVHSNRPELRELFQGVILPGRKVRTPKIDVYPDEWHWITYRLKKDYENEYGRR